MFVRSRFSPWNTDIALGAAEKKVARTLAQPPHVVAVALLRALQLPARRLVLAHRRPGGRGGRRGRGLGVRYGLDLTPF